MKNKLFLILLFSGFVQANDSDLMVQQHMYEAKANVEAANSSNKGAKSAKNPYSNIKMHNSGKNNGIKMHNPGKNNGNSNNGIKMHRPHGTVPR